MTRWPDRPQPRGPTCILSTRPGLSIPTCETGMMLPRCAQVWCGSRRVLTPVIQRGPNPCQKEAARDRVGSGGTANGRWSGKRLGSEAQESRLPHPSSSPRGTHPTTTALFTWCLQLQPLTWPGSGRFLPDRPRPTSESAQPGDLRVGGTRAGGSCS